MLIACSWSGPTKTSEGIAASLPYIIKNGVTPIDPDTMVFMAIVTAGTQWIQFCCSTFLIFALSNSFIAPKNLSTGLCDWAL